MFPLILKILVKKIRSLDPLLIKILSSIDYNKTSDSKIKTLKGFKANEGTRETFHNALQH